jgi:hypothetical protein
MALLTGNILLRHPIQFTDTNDIVGQHGGAYRHNGDVNLSVTGVFPTGTSTVPGGSDEVRYAKLFFVHSGTAGDILTNPLLYVTNESISNQIKIAPDPYWVKENLGSATPPHWNDQTGMTVNRTTVPTGLVAASFSGYTVSSPMDLKALSGTTITVDKAGVIGFWVQRTVQAGLPTNDEATFNIGLKGEI